MSTNKSELRKFAVVSTLRSCQMFVGLSLADLENIAAVSLVKALDKGEYLFHEGDPAHCFYVVQCGAVNVHRVNAAGREQVIHIFRAGESFAEATLAMGQGYPADACAVESTRVLLVQKEGILSLLKRQPELALRMLGSMGAHLRVIVGQLDDLTLKNVETRLANWLVKRCPDIKSEKPFRIPIGVTKRILAAELGTVSETFSRTLGKFRDQKLVKVEGKTITVLSPLRMAELLRRNLGE